MDEYEYLSEIIRKYSCRVAALDSKMEQLRRDYVINRLFPKDPFYGMSRSAKSEGQKIKQIAEASGFRVFGARSDTSGFKNILIGDIHFTKKDPERLMYHPDIAAIIIQIVNEGLLTRGDFACVEGAHGELNYKKSVVYENQSGENDIFVIYDEAMTRIKVISEKRYFLSKAFKTLRDHGVRTVYDDYTRTLRKLCEKYREESQIIDVLFQARVHDGFLQFLNSTDRKCVQVFGLQNLIAVEPELNSSVISVIPADLTVYLGWLYDQVIKSKRMGF